MRSKNLMPETAASAYKSEDFDAFIQKERHEMLRYVSKEASTVLDVGCAVGSFGELLKSNYPVEVWGIEINEYAATEAANKLDKVICGAFDENLDLPQAKFDCIVFNDVLEHLVDPYNALLYAKILLKDGGTIVASIPNVRYFDNIWKLLIDKDWKYTQNGILDRTHLRFFTYRSILSTFNKLGYQVELIEGINPLENEHSHRVRSFKFLNSILLNQIEDMRYLQFAVIARPKVL